MIDSLLFRLHTKNNPKEEMRQKKIDDVINDLEYQIEKLNFVKSQYPDVKIKIDKVHGYQFSSKSVNSSYSNFIFISRRYMGLYVISYCELDFSFQGKNETIKIYSSPKNSRLIYLTWRRHPETNKPIMKFARFSFNLKNNAFKDELVGSCKAAVAKFIQDNPEYHLDTKNLDHRLKKLLAFS